MPADSDSGDRIDSWKKIAVYLGRDPRTTIRWEKEKNLPIHRTPGGQRQSVFAFRHELDAWLVSQKSTSANMSGAGQAGGEKNEDGNEPNGPVAGGRQPEAPSVAASPPGEAPQAPPKSHSARPRRLIAAAGLAAILFLAAAAWRLTDNQIGFQAPHITGQQQLTENGLPKDWLVTDGQNLYFGEEQDGWMALAAMPEDGGQVRIFWNPQANVLPLDVSPDGGQLLAVVYRGYERDRELWVAPLHVGKPYRLAGITAHAAAWEPAGKRIAYAAGTRIYLANADGTASREIGSYTAVPEALHWSADGKRLRFQLVDAVTEKQSSWELASTDGMATTTLNSLPSSVEHTDYDFWTPVTSNDAQFFIEPQGSGGGEAVWIVHHSQAWWEPITQTARLPLKLEAVSGAAFDEKSQRLFVLSGHPARSTAVRVDPRTGEFREILPDISGTALDYSRDGQRLAYVSTQDQSLWISRADGGTPRQITAEPYEVQLPRWSPAGRQIAYMERKSNTGAWRIYIRQVDTGEAREAAEGDENQGAPTWSPDGRFIYYGKVKCQPTHSCAIRRIDLATGRVQTVPGSEGLFTARMSPDGRHIAAIEPEQHLVMLFDVATQKWRKLADAVNGTDLSWSSDSRFVYTDMPGANARIARICVADGLMETAADLRSQDFFALAQDDLGFSIAPDGAVVVHHRMNAAEVFAYDLK